MLWNREGKRKQIPPPITPIEHFKALVGDHVKTKFYATIFDWGREILLSVLLDPRAKDFFSVTDEEQQTVLLQKAEEFAMEELQMGIDETLSSKSKGCLRPPFSLFNKLEIG